MQRKARRPRPGLAGVGSQGGTSWRKYPDLEGRAAPCEAEKGENRSGVMTWDRVWYLRPFLIFSV